MQTNAFPQWIVALLFGSGLLVIAIAIPLALRRVPPNWAYGLRIAATFADETVWYEINARAGRDLIGIAAAFLVALTIGQTLGKAWPHDARVLVPIAVLIIGLIITTVRNTSAANRMLAEIRAAKKETSAS